MKKLLYYFRYITIGILLLGIYPSTVNALEIKKDATPVIYVIMVDATDGYTAETDITSPTVYYVKQGGSATSLGSPTWAELDKTNMPGLYSVLLTGAMTDTVGELIVYITKAGSRTFRKAVNIVANLESDSYGKVSGLTYTTANQVDARVLTNSDKTGYTASTVSDKTGYSLTQTFPANFSVLSISATTGLVDFTQTAADKVWATAVRTLTSGGGISAADVWDYNISGYTDAGKAGTYLKGAGGGASPADIADAVWNELMAGHTTARSFGKVFKDEIDGIRGLFR